MSNVKLVIVAAVTATLAAVDGICAQSSQAADTVPVFGSTYDHASTNLGIESSEEIPAVLFRRKTVAET